MLCTIFFCSFAGSSEADVFALTEKKSSRKKEPQKLFTSKPIYGN